MSKELRTKLIILVTLIVISVVSIFVVEPWITSEEHNAKSIATLDEKKATVMKLTAASTATATIITMLPNDIGTPVSEKIADLSGYFMIILCAIYLEKYLLTITGYFAFKWLIPIACLLCAVNLYFDNRTVKKLAAKIAVFGLAISIAIPASVSVSAMIESQYSDSINATINEATSSSDELSGSASDDSEDSEATDASDSTDSSNSTDSSESSEKSFIDKAKDFINSAADTAKDTVDTVKNSASNAAETITSGANEIMEQAREVLNNFLEAAAVMLITSCVIPILVIVFFFWLIKIILEIDMDVPDFRRHGPGHGPVRGPKHGPGRGKGPFKGHGPMPEPEMDDFDE